MSDDPKSRPHRRATWLIVAMLVVVFVLYPLSIGPAVVLCEHGYISEEALTTTYFPIIYVGSKFEMTWRLVKWYCKHWIEL